MPNFIGLLEPLSKWGLKLSAISKSAKSLASVARFLVSRIHFPFLHPFHFSLKDINNDKGVSKLACADCEDCAAGLENYCDRMVQTYNSRYPDGTKTYGGYANYWRGPSGFVFKIPDAMPAAEAAPMLCAGVTLYMPLTRYGCGPGKKVGIIGIGGLGHFGILFAKALGADRVVALSRSGAKRDDAMMLGADEYVATDEDKGWTEKHVKSLDIVISTVSNPQVSQSSKQTTPSIRQSYDRRHICYSQVRK